MILILIETMVSRISWIGGLHCLLLRPYGLGGSISASMATMATMASPSDVQFQDTWMREIFDDISLYENLSPRARLVSIPVSLTLLHRWADVEQKEKIQCHLRHLLSSA